MSKMNSSCVCRWLIQRRSGEVSTRRRGWKWSLKQDMLSKLIEAFEFISELHIDSASKT